MTDYVISRKRSRPFGSYAVDPCLGYYVHKSNSARREDTEGHAEIWEAYNHGPADDNDCAECVIPSSIPEENELDAGFREEVTAGVDQEVDDTSSDWIQLVPGRSKRTSPPTIPKQAPSADVAPYHDTEITTLYHAPILTVEGFLKASSRSYRKPQKTYRKKATSRTHRPKSNHAPVQVHCSSPIISAGSEAGGAHEADNTLALRSRAIARVQPGTDGLTSGASSASSERGSPSVSTCSQSPSVIRRQRRKYTKPLKQRIYEASVATHGHPEDEFAQDEPDPTRPPLRFVPGPSTSNSTCHRTVHSKRKWALVDPRKTQAIRTASFSSKIQRAPRVLSNGDSSALRTYGGLVRFPAEHWVWDAHPGTGSSVLDSKAKASLKEGVPHVVASADSRAADYPPLLMLPLSPGQGSPGYQSLFRGKRGRGALVADPERNPKRRKKVVTSNACDLPLDIPLKQRPVRAMKSGKRPSNRKATCSPARPTLNLVPFTVKQAISNSHLESYPLPEFSQQVSIDVCTPSLQPPTMHASPYRADSITSQSHSDIGNEAITSPICDPESSSHYYQTPIVPSQLAASFAPVDSQNRATENHALDLISPDSSAPLPPTKPLRSLESFMDEFLDTVRTVSARRAPTQGRTNADKQPRRSKTGQAGPCLQRTGKVDYPLSHGLSSEMKGIFTVWEMGPGQ